MLWIKVTDTDGEFLLVEAANALPPWLEPETADNRVWIHTGKLTIIQPDVATRKAGKSLKALKLQQALELIKERSTQVAVSPDIEAEAFRRLQDYPQKIDSNMHHALVRLPRKIAYLLRQKPSYISAATEAFYLRDPVALKPLQLRSNRNLIFDTLDLVTVSVKFPRVGYAQIKSQEFPPPPAWAASMTDRTDKKMQAHSETGMKVSCGFEMLLSDPQNQDKPVVREMKILLEDLESGDDTLPDDETILKWELREDDESWLDINYEDLDRELAGKSGKNVKAGAFGDAAAQENLQRIVAQFEQFLNDDKAGLDGAGLFDEDTDDEDDIDEYQEDSDDKDEVPIDQEKFNKMMGKLTGSAKRSTLSTDMRPPAANRVEELESDEEAHQDDSKEIEELSRQMEKELKSTGALNLGKRVRTTGSTQKAVENVVTDSGSDSTEEYQDSDDGEDMDVTLAKNMLESFKSQAGMAGPGGNMMRMMGLSLPRDEPGHEKSRGS